MRATNQQRSVWELVRRQHGVITRAQLLELGFSSKAVERRMANGRLFHLYRGVYAVGRPETSQHGRWMAAVLACGPNAVLSHQSAAALWSMRKANGIYEVSVAGSERRRPGLTVHRRSDLAATDVSRRDGIPVTTPATTLVDIAAQLGRKHLEAALNEADKRELISLPSLHAVLDRAPRRPGAKPMKDLIADWTFTLTDSELERLFLPIARAAGLPLPTTGSKVNGFKVDFFFEDLGLVVETDGGRFHRTAAQQTADRIRDQRHFLAGMTPVRFTHNQVAKDARHVGLVLRAAVRQLSGSSGRPSGGGRRCAAPRRR